MRQKRALFGVKTAHFLFVFYWFKIIAIDYQAFTKMSKTRLFSTNNILFQNDARF